MKLAPNQLGMHCAKALLPIYLVTGDEPLLVDEACQLLRDAARKQGFVEREVMYEESHFNWQELLTKNSNFSLFASQKLLELNLLSSKLPEKASTALLTYCDNLDKSNILLIRAGKLEKAQASTKWYKTLEKVGAVVTVWPVTSTQLLPWVEARLRLMKLTATIDALQLLCDSAENNLLVIQQTLEKLKILSPQEKITAKIMQEVVAQQARFNIFDVVDPLLLGEIAKVLKILTVLEAENEEPVIILWALAKEIRQLLQITFRKQRGEALEAILNDLKIWEKRKPILKKAAQRLTYQKLKQSLCQATQADRVLKGITPGNRWQAIRELVIQL